MLGHDLRTPLSVVHLSASYLLRSDTLNGAQMKAVARILTSADRMTDMVKDILDFSQTAFGVTLPITPAPADLGETQKAEGERRAGSSGLGLGLYITREIAAAHGGSVEVNSDEEGTTFCVQLPRAPSTVDRTLIPAR